MLGPPPSHIPAVLMERMNHQQIQKFTQQFVILNKTQNSLFQGIFNRAGDHVGVSRLGEKFNIPRNKNFDFKSSSICFPQFIQNVVQHD